MPKEEKRIPISDDQERMLKKNASVITRTMTEQSMLSGAYCQDIDTFREIYRYVERRMKRTNMSAYMILFTLFPKKGVSFSKLFSKAAHMEQLGECIRSSLRTSDLYTRYSSSQYLVMLCDLSLENAEMVAGRIIESYSEKLGAEMQHVLLHYCFPLRPAE